MGAPSTTRIARSSPWRPSTSSSASFGAHGGCFVRGAEVVGAEHDGQGNVRLGAHHHGHRCHRNMRRQRLRPLGGGGCPALGHGHTGRAPAWPCSRYRTGSLFRPAQGLRGRLRERRPRRRHRPSLLCGSRGDPERHHASRLLPGVRGLLQGARPRNHQDNRGPRRGPVSRPCPGPPDAGLRRLPPDNARPAPHHRRGPLPSAASTTPRATRERASAWRWSLPRS